MIKNYFKTAWRNLVKNKALSFINISGLAVGMAFAILIGLWISYEMSFDKFHENGSRIAMVRKHILANNEKQTQTSVPLPLYDELKANYPDIKRASRMDWVNMHGIQTGDTRLNKRGLYVDPDFLKMFSFPLLKGDMETALKDPNSILLTESLATALFGKEEAIGKIIKIDNKFDVMVAGILRDVPKNSTLQFEFLSPFEFKIQNFKWIRDAKSNWGNNFIRTFVEIKEGASMDALEGRIKNLMATKNKRAQFTETFFLFPVGKWHLYRDFKDWVNTGGKIEYIRLFGIIGLFILLIACINFMNLSTARSEKRAKEVGIRKAIGSQRRQLILQFLMESLVTTVLAFGLTIILVQLLLPLLKDLDFENIRFDWSNLLLLLSVLGVCILTGLIAGSYPALYLSSFKPVKVLKGLFRQGRGAAAFRKTLVVSQFVISIGLIVCTAIVFQQIKHAQNRSIGYDPNNLISLEASTDLAKNYEAFKWDLLNTGLIEAVTKASSPMTGIYNTWSDFSWEGKDPNASLSLDVLMTEWDYKETTGIKLKMGRSFSRHFPTDSNAVILNEAAMKLIGYKDPIGRSMQLQTSESSFRTLTIVGVIEDMLVDDPFKPVSPAVILFDADNVSNFFIRLKPSSGLDAGLAAIKPIWAKHNPSMPFEYSFADENFAQKFTTEKQVAKLAGIFAGLAVFISCLGLFGLAMFMAERRTKEIGIRKVLGASVSNLWILLSREFIWLVLIACVIASPLALWMMHDWLQKYDYRITIGWWVFIVAGLIAVIIALFTVSTQAIKVALRNPVKSLRTE